MYGKIFATIFTGSMRGQSDLQLVFINMIATCDEDGVVDKVPRAIAEETGLPIERVNAAIKELSSPDEMSRSQEHQGRRIVLIDPNRTWGWQIVNYATYRAITTREKRREYRRLYMSEYRSPDGQPPPVGYDEACKIYDSYPRKVGKPAAIAKILAALKKESATHLLDRTKAFAASTASWPQADKCFIPHPSTWFHQERYNDDPSTWQRGTVQIQKHRGPNLGYAD